MANRKGELKPISVIVKIRAGRKACTLITGHEQFGLKSEDIAEALKAKCASSTTGASHNFTTPHAFSLLSTRSYTRTLQPGCYVYFASFCVYSFVTSRENKRRRSHGSRETAGCGEGIFDDCAGRAEEVDGVDGRDGQEEEMMCVLHIICF